MLPGVSEVCLMWPWDFSKSHQLFLLVTEAAGHRYVVRERKGGKE